MSMNETQIMQAYELAKARFAAMDVDTDVALNALAGIPISLHCWQGDDVKGFEGDDVALGGGIAVTGNYPGQARNAAELRADLDLAYSLIPGTHRLNLHALYAETGGKSVERSDILPEHFANWIDWAKANGHGLDFNPSCFSHPLADDGFTLASYDPAKRQFWIDHCIASRRIGEAMGKALGTPCVTNVWIPDGYKDTPADRKAPRERLKAALDEVFAEELDPRYNLDAVEAKLFGLGSECYVVGSHEFYMGYAMANDKLLCLDTGHFHPTEVVSDKLSAAFLWVNEILLHVSRGVRWDSDHVVTLNEELRALMGELVRGKYLDRTHIGLDYFDGSINRVAAWVIGTRNAQLALLMALLEPTATLQKMEIAGDFTGRLALQESLKAMPVSAVWDMFCLQKGVPAGYSYMDAIRAYEADVLVQRS